MKNAAMKNFIVWVTCKSNKRKYYVQSYELVSFSSFGSSFKLFA